MSRFKVIHSKLTSLEEALNEVDGEFEIESHVISVNGNHTVILKKPLPEEGVEDLGFEIGVRCDRSMQNLPGLPRCVLQLDHEGDCRFS